jgi:hypothetical protein
MIQVIVALNTDKEYKFKQEKRVLIFIKQWIEIKTIS